MYEIKKQIYLDFTKNQKSALCNYLRALVKKSPDWSVEEIWESFVADEKYYLELNCSRFEFLAEVIDEQWFETDSIKYLKECKKQLYYYDRLCKKYGIEKKELESKLEARNIIDKIITEHSTGYKIDIDTTGNEEC